MRLVRIERFAARKQDIPVGQIKRAHKAAVIKMMRDRTDDFRAEIDFEGIAVSLLHKQYLLSVMGKIGALTEISEPGNMRREMVGGVCPGFGSVRLVGATDGQGRGEY